MKMDYLDVVINLFKIFFDYFFYFIEVCKFEIFDLKCDYKLGYLD